MIDRVARVSVLSALLLTACGPSVPDEDGGPGADAGDAGAPIDGGPSDGGEQPPVCPDGCLVGTVCYPDGVADPTDPCRVCDVGRSATAFSPNEGAICDDGAFCTTGDRCTAEGACAGAPRACDDGIACNGVATCDEDIGACAPGAPTCTGGQVCDAITGACVLECSGCLIDGSCYGDGQINSLDPCLVCSVSESRSAWSANDGAACDDGLFCTTSDTCADGACAGGPARACSNGVACDGLEICDEAAGGCLAGTPTCGASEVCDVGSDSCVAVCTGCVIGGVCFGAGQRNPANACEVCAPSASRTAWTANDGAACDDGLFCTAGDVCAGTSCAGAARSCSDGVACNGAESCDEAADACASGAPTCASGTLCDVATDACVTTCSGCVIAGVCYGAGQINPSNPCEACTPAISASAWSDADGARCDDGLFCTDGDVCAGGACGGAPRTCSDGVACNGVETCDEGADVCVGGATTCSASEVCDVAADACVTRCGGCAIGGVCYADGTRNPSNECEVCDLARSSSSWSTNDGAACDDGEFCTRGDMCSGGLCAGSATDFCGDGVACNGAETCDEAADRCVAGATTCASGQVCDRSADACVTACSGCVIGGVCYADGTRNPANACQRCEVGSAASAWTVDAGAACDDGLFCTVLDTCSASATCAGTPRSCADGVACNGAEACNESADRCDAGASTCGAGELCDPATDTCRTTCSGCVIGGTCYAAMSTNPANACQVCDPSVSTAAWTARAGASCDDGLYCTVGETCSAAAVCGGGVARDCRDGVACNGDEACDESTDRCVTGAPTCTGGTVCDVAADMCVLVCVGGSTRCGASCVDTANDPANCGGCGSACAAWEHCAGGACVAACSSGFADCDGVTSNGCETDLTSDLSSCGACGAVCTGAHATPTCSSGTCSLSCDPGWGDCNGLVDDGCEVDLASDAAHCGTCGTACTAPAGGTPSCDDGSCVFTVPASAVERWETPVSATMLSIWADGTLHVTNGTTTANVDPTTGALTSVPPPGGRASVWIDAGVSQSINGGITDRRGYAQDGTLAWEWIGLLCCNWNEAMAIDDVAGLAYTSQNGELFRIDLSTGAGSSWIGGGTWGGRDSIRGTSVWVAGFSGQVTRYDVATRTADFTVDIDPGGDPGAPRLYPGAVLADGSFVVTTTTGRIARVLTDGTVAWNLAGYAIETAPITLGPMIAAGSAAAPRGIAAFDGAGTYVGGVPTSAAVRDLLHGDGDRMYALLASGEVIVVDVARAAIVGTYTGLPSSGEMLLRDGVLYVLGDGRLHAIPVASSGYEPTSAWPVMHHDNQRTSNALAPLTF